MDGLKILPGSLKGFFSRHRQGDELCALESLLSMVEVNIFREPLGPPVSLQMFLFVATSQARPQGRRIVEKCNKKKLKKKSADTH